MTETFIQPIKPTEDNYVYLQKWMHLEALKISDKESFIYDTRHSKI